MKTWSTAAALTLAMVGLASGGNTDDLPDPLPIRRVELPAGRAAAELGRASDGVLVRMKRKEFERLVQRAARAKKARQQAARLVEARYRASLVDGPSPQLSGTAVWKILHPGPGPGFLRLSGDGPTFNLAVSQPRFDKGDALFTEFPDPAAEGRGRSLAIYLDRAGEHTVTMEWTARVDPRPEGLHVDLRLPECPAAALELEVPADCTVAQVDGAPVIGPNDTATSGRKVWRLATGGKGQVGLLLRKSGPPAADGMVFAWQKTVQRLTRDGLEATAAFTVEALDQDVRELTLEFDPLLRPVDVSAPGLGRTETQAPVGGAPGRMTLRLARPLREGTVEVRCVAPLSATLPDAAGGRPLTVAWVSPGLRLVNAVPRGETLELWVHPDLRLVSWRAGDYRLVDSALVSDGEGKAAYRRLTLQGGGVGPPGDPRQAPRRPGGTIEAGCVEFRARQQSWWRLGDEAMSLVSQLDYEVRQGQLFQLPLRLPTGWEVEAVELTPPELLRSWGVRRDKGRPLLQAELRRPLSAGARTASLTVRLRGAAPRAGQEVAFPDVEPVGARFREGGLAVDFEEQAQSAEVVSPLVSVEPPPGGVWGKLLPDYYYPFRGENPRGTLRLHPRPDRLRTRAHTALLIAAAPGGGRAALEAHLLLEAESGMPAAVDLHLSAGERPWDWHADAGPARNRVRRVERHLGHEAGSALAPLAASSPLGAAALAALRPAGSFWRVWLERPLAVRQPLTLRATCAVEADNRGGAPRWHVPLVTVLNGGPHAGELTISHSAADLHVVAAAGLREAAPRTDRTAEGELWRAYRYEGPWATLTVEARHVAQAPVAGSASVITRAALTSTLTAEGELRHHFRFRLERWRQYTLPLVLPVGARLLAVGIAGRWLEHPGTPDESNRLSLPVPSGQRAADFEILYTTPAAAGPLLGRLEAPAPALPLSVGSFERLWLLPPGVQPIGDGEAVPLPGGAAAAEPMSPSARLLGLYRAGPVLPLPGFTGERRTEREHALHDAFAALRNDRGGATLPLAEVVAELTSVHLQQGHPLVIDRDGLAAAGVSGTTQVQVAAKSDREDRDTPWKENGLLFRAGERGVLLTARAETRSWSADALPEGVERALARAAERGRDPSGRFVSALEWLAGDGRTVPQQGLFGPAAEPGWTAWAPRAGVDGDSLTVVHAEAVRAGGIALAALPLTLAVLLRRRKPVARVRLLLLWLMAAGLALAWLPAALVELAWWPLVSGVTLGVIWYVAWASGLLHARPAAPPPAAAAKSSRDRAALVGPAAGLVLLLVSRGPARPADPPPQVVFLLPAAKGEADASVLVPARLVEQLEAMARPALAPCTVLVSGRYEGKVVGDAAEFAATLEAQALGEGPLTLELPFDGVQLVGDVRVDGARALPVALPAPRAGYSVRLRGPGRHKVELRFRAAVTAPGDEEGMRQVSFNVPPLVQSRLAFQAPEGARHLRVPFKHGGARFSNEVAAPAVEADLGAITAPVRLRWSQEPARPRAPRVEFQEAYLWDLRPDASLLTALVRYQISPGGVTSLALDLPPELAVRSVQARRPPPDKALIGDLRSLIDPIRLAGWQVHAAAEGRVLRLDFPAPVSGGVEVTLELAPRAPWAGTVLLPLPAPQGVASAATPSYLAYRHQGLHVTRTNWLRLTGIRPDEFAPFWPSGSRPPTSTLAYASSFRREPRHPPELRLQVRVEPAPVAAAQTLALQVGPSQAELTALVEARAADKGLSLLEWEITSAPPVTIATVTGPAVSRWSQTGNRLLVWLERTVESASLTLTGWLPLARPVAALEIPCFRLIAPGEVRTQVAVTPGPGLTLAAEGLEHLTPARSARAGELSFTATQPAYRGRVLLHPGVPPEVDVVTTGWVEGKEVVFSSAVDCRLHGDLRALTVRLRDWPGDAWLDAPPTVVTRRREEHRSGSGRRERAWTLELAPAVKGPVRLTVRGRLPLEEGADGLRMPALQVAGAEMRQRLVVGAGLRAESRAGLVPAPAPPGAQAWQTSPDAGRSGWHLRVVPRERPHSGPVRLVFAELRAAVPDGRHWEYEARLWPQSEGTAELRLRLAADARLLGVRLDGEALPVREPEGGVVWLPLPGPGGLREVVLRYRRGPGGDALASPDLGLPQLEGAEPCPTLWTVYVPAGFDLSGPGAPERLGAGATRRLVLELYRAELALAQSHEFAAARDADALAQAQRRFARACWLAELALESGGDGRRPASPAGEPASAWLARLRQEKLRLAREQQLGSLREEEERKTGQFFLPHDLPGSAGTPYSWLVERGERVPLVGLAPQEQRRVQQALVFSGQWLVLLLALFAVTFSAGMLALARWLWPEHLLLAGALGWHFVGATAVVLALLLAGVLGRLLWLALRAQTHLRRRGGEGGASRR